MHHHASERKESLRGYPNLTVAAAMLKVSISTLSRRADLNAERRGDRDIVIPAEEVLRLAAIYRNRSLNDVAQALIDHATTSGPEQSERVLKEVEAFFGGRTVTQADTVGFLETARHLLPPPLVAEIEKALQEDTEALPDTIVGWLPLPDS